MKTKIAGLSFALILLFTTTVADTFSAAFLRQLDRIILIGTVRSGGILRSGTDLDAFLEAGIEDPYLKLYFKTTANVQVKIYDVATGSSVYSTTINATNPNGALYRINISSFDPGDYELVITGTEINLRGYFSVE